MQLQAQNESELDIEIDRATNTIRMTRIVDATPEEVFEAWTRPEHLTHWWDPAGEPLTVCETDPRAGGSFKFVSKGHEDMPFEGTYKEMAPPQRMVFIALGATGRVLLTTAGSRTKMVVEIEAASAEHLQQFIAMGIDKGTAKTLDNLVAYLSR